MRSPGAGKGTRTLEIRTPPISPAKRRQIALRWAEAAHARLGDTIELGVIDPAQRCAHV